MSEEIEGIDFKIVKCHRCSADVRINRIAVDDETCERCDFELSDDERLVSAAN